MISCLTVTRESRLESLRHSIACFAAQSWAERELIIVHDGDAGFERSVHGILSGYRDIAWTVRGVRGNPPLGALRNAAVALANGAMVCQWDDDDLSHPHRLRVQYERLRAHNGDFCFFTDQLHWFKPQGVLFWDDWNVEPYPMNLIQGTLLGYKEKLRPYPELSRGEDTPVVTGLVQEGHRVVKLGGSGYLYIYVYHGGNAWDFRHHAAISAWKRLRRDRLLANESVLRAHLSAYRLDTDKLVMPYDDGALEIPLQR